MWSSTSLTTKDHATVRTAMEVNKTVVRHVNSSKVLLDWATPVVFQKNGHAAPLIRGRCTLWEHGLGRWFGTRRKRPRA